ncbi:hypothetical protein VTH06DRAFT_2255 [Thermothelomyces fergusii]
MIPDKSNNETGGPLPRGRVRVPCGRSSLLRRPDSVEGFGTTWHATARGPTDRECMATEAFAGTTEATTSGDV